MHAIGKTDARLHWWLPPPSAGSSSRRKWSSFLSPGNIWTR